ncbi:YlxR family protein [Cloacibacillus sp. An23]|uniref:RNase P modulator RnpM n=1 Tax=Cloacibacillus sp. An23 TaxID=1965591 RepID=UPI000B386E86|nr:YlxR family protein [Cloacibacillus sp. An23]OUO93061.1 nucleic acid-binding protein [Cloacibacillus sp. An23]
MAKAVKQPVKKQRPRTCVGCGEESPKRTLLRIVRSPEGEVRYDPTGKANGRGAYLCADPSCVAAAKKKKSLSRALKAEVPESLYDELTALCAEKGGEA